MLIMLDAPGSRMIIFVFLKTQDCEDPGRKQKRISAIANWQMPWEDLKYYTLSKDFLKSLDPLKEVVYPELPPLDIPGAEEIKEGQLELF